MTTSKMQATDTLHFIIKVKSHPYSGKNISIAISCAWHPDFNTSKALLFTEVPLGSKFKLVDKVMQVMQVQLNALRTSVNISDKLMQALVK